MALGLIFKEVAPFVSIAINFIPIIGQIKGIAEVIIGKDIITGQQIPLWARGVEGIISFIPFAKGVFSVTKAGFRATAKGIANINRASREGIQKLALLAYLSRQESIRLFRQGRINKIIEYSEVYNATKQVATLSENTLNIARRIQSGRLSTIEKDAVTDIANALGESSKSAKSDDILNLERSLDENASYQVSQPKVKGRMRKPGSEELVPPFSALNLSQSMIKAGQRFIGKRFNSNFKRAWSNANNARARKDISKVSSLMKQGTNQSIQKARKLARQAFNRYRRRFWNAVKKDSKLVTMLKDAGFQIPRKYGRAPYYEFPNGYREYLTIEHMFRVLDSPQNALNSNLMQLVLFRENVNTLEFIRSNSTQFL